MRNENAEVPSMDDLVFENRNKEYGAYALRKAYSDNVHKALLYVLMSFAGVMVFILFFPGAPTIKVPALTHQIIELGNFTQTKPEVTPPSRTTAPTRRAPSHVAPMVTTQVEPPVEEVQNNTDVTGDPNGVLDGAEPIGDIGPIGGDVPAAPVVDVTPKGPVDHAEFMPEYKGGLQAMARFVQRNLKYPAVARRMETEGIVFVSFVVNTDGRVIDVKAIKGISKECDEEAVRMVSSMTDWLAGRQGNIPVMVRMVLPIRFQLNR